MLKSVVVILATWPLVLLSSCSPVEKKEVSLQSPWKDDSYAETYFLQDQSCQDTSGSDAVEESKVMFWQDGAVAEQQYTFANATSNPYLRSTHVGKTMFGFHQRRDCRGHESDATCEAKSNVVEVPRQLKVCAGNDYKRNSVEGVALTAMALLERSATNYRNIPGAKQEEAKPNLLVLPKVETIYSKTVGTKVEFITRLDTDNLAYAPSFGGSPVFVIFPKGKRAKELGYWQNTNLWEVPWAMAHEYGHHIFQIHTEKKTASGLHGHRSFAESETGFFLQSADQIRIWGALNEGFADLFAHFATNENERPYQGLDCFEKSRDVDSDKFADGREKRLDKDAFEIFFGDDGEKAGRCNETNLKDIHYFGAAIAHGVFSLLTEKYGDDSSAKMTWLLGWADTLGTLRNNTDIDGGFVDYLAPVAELITDSPDKDKSCSILYKTFPYVSEQILHKSEIVCAQ